LRFNQLRISAFNLETSTFFAGASQTRSFPNSFSSFQNHLKNTCHNWPMSKNGIVIFQFSPSKLDQFWTSWGLKILTQMEYASQAFGFSLVTVVFD
jgi:hypothetical protein